MSPAAVALVLAAAVAHASWNLFGKQAAETGAAFFVWLLAVSAGSEQPDEERRAGLSGLLAEQVPAGVRDSRG